MSETMAYAHDGVGLAQDGGMSRRSLFLSRV